MTDLGPDKGHSLATAEILANEEIELFRLTSAPRITPNRDLHRRALEAIFESTCLTVPPDMRDGPDAIRELAGALPHMRVRAWCYITDDYRSFGEMQPTGPASQRGEGDLLQRLHRLIAAHVLRELQQMD